MTQAILLAEDSPDDELLFKRILQRAGVLNPIYVVRDGDEAIAYLKGEGAFADRQAYPLPAVLFLDMKMPRVHGFEVLQWIGTRPDLKGLLIIALSHFGETREISRAYALGARTFLSKPLTQADVDNLAIPFRKYWLLSTASGNSHNPNKDAGGGVLVASLGFCDRFFLPSNAASEKSSVPAPGPGWSAKPVK